MAKKKTNSKQPTNSSNNLVPGESKKLNKTAAIREELTASPNGSPSAIAKKLAAKGIEVTPAYVSTIKNAEKKRTGKRRSKPGRPPSRTASPLAGSNNGASSVELLKTAFDLVLQAGPDEARNLIALAERLVHRVGAL